MSQTNLIHCSDSSPRATCTFPPNIPAPLFLDSILAFNKLLHRSILVRWSPSRWVARPFRQETPANLVPQWRWSQPLLSERQAPRCCFHPTLPDSRMILLPGRFRFSRQIQHRTCLSIRPAASPYSPVPHAAGLRPTRDVDTMSI